MGAQDEGKNLSTLSFIIVCMCTQTHKRAPVRNIPLK